MAKTLYLLRHGSIGSQGRYIGATDLPLVPEGYAQLESSAELLRQEGIVSVFSSPLCRCLQTVERLRLNAELIVHPALREIDFGEWEGLTFPEIARNFPKDVQSWASWSTAFSFPGGENTGEFLTRVRAASELLDSHPAEKVLVVSHGGMIRQLLCHYLGLEPQNYLAFDIAPGKYSTLSLHSEGGVLTALNLG